MKGVNLYIGIIDEALNDGSEREMADAARTFYAEHPKLSFVAALMQLREVDVLNQPAVAVFEKLKKRRTSVEHVNYHDHAINAALEEFEKYKNYVARALSNFTQCFAATGEMKLWATRVKLTDLQTDKCEMWRRIAVHRSSPVWMNILDGQLEQRLLEARSDPDRIRPPLPFRSAFEEKRSRVVTHAEQYLNATLEAARNTLRSAWREAVHNRITKMAGRKRPEDYLCDDCEVPHFAPTLLDLVSVRLSAC